jgi:hypothetical protein
VLGFVLGQFVARFLKSNECLLCRGALVVPVGEFFLGC